MQPYFEKPGFVLYRGNCLDILANMEKDSVNMVFADPPYNLSNGGFSVHAGKRVSVNKGDWDKSHGVDVDLKFHLNWIEACRKVLSPPGTIWISGTYHSIYQCGYALQKLDFKILNDISWYKPNAAPNLSGRYFTASHETLIWARKEDKAKHTFNYKDMKNGSWPEDLFKNPGKQMRSAWAIPEIQDFGTISTPKRTEKNHVKHPTQKPIALLNRIILATTNKGDTVLDPFTRSSTTGLAATKNNRQFIGIDMEIRYLDLSIKRYLESMNNNLDKSD
jgi:site-specific DNA-methyltransferase (adenine-specific)